MLWCEVLYGQNVVLLMDDVCDIDVEVVDVMDVQELLVVVERCLEGTEEVTNPNDVGYYVDDDHHSLDGVKDLHFHDAFLSPDERLFLDVYLDDLFGLHEDELQSPFLDDYLDLLGQQDVCYFLYVDVFVDDISVVDVELVLLALDVEVADVVLLLYHDVDVLEDDDCKRQFPSC